MKYIQLFEQFVESVNEQLTSNEVQIKAAEHKKPEAIYYFFYKGQFAATYSGVFGITGLTDMYWDKFKVRKPAGSKFKLNPEFITVSKKTYDANPEHYTKMKPYVDAFWDKLKEEN